MDKSFYAAEVDVLEFKVNGRAFGVGVEEHVLWPRDEYWTLTG